MTQKPKQKMTDAERLELAAKLDRELDEFISGLEKKPYTEGWPEDKWQEEMEKHPFFMTKPPEPGSEMHPLYEGLQQLKYDPAENTPEDLASAYKEDGNFNFKHQKYRMAIISYTEGIKVKCGNPEIESTLLNNRSAANYYLKNYRSSLRDCNLALNIKPDYEKVIIRAANCSYELGEYEKAMAYCNKILEKQNSHKAMQELSQKCNEAMQLREKDQRLKQRVVARKTMEQANLIRAIKKRNVKVAGCTGNKYSLDDFEPVLPPLKEFKVHLNEENKLVWPVTFVYPEYKVIDFIQQFCEDETFYQHLHVVFEEKPHWDVEHKYIPDKLRVYFKENDSSKTHLVDVNATLGQTLQHERFTVHSGIPSFLIVVENSDCEKEFL